MGGKRFPRLFTAFPVYNRRQVCYFDNNRKRITANWKKEEGTYLTIPQYSSMNQILKYKNKKVSFQRYILLSTRNYIRCRTQGRREKPRASGGNSCGPPSKIKFIEDVTQFSQIHSIYVILHQFLTFWSHFLFHSIIFTKNIFSVVLEVTKICVISKSYHYSQISVHLLF